MSGLYRGYLWAYWLGITAGILLATYAWWALVPAVACGIVAYRRRVL